MHSTLSVSVLEAHGMGNMANMNIPKSAFVSKYDYAPAVAIYYSEMCTMGALRGHSINSSKKNNALKMH